MIRSGQLVLVFHTVMVPAQENKFECQTTVYIHKWTSSLSTHFDLATMDKAELIAWLKNIGAKSYSTQRLPCIVNEDIGFVRAI